MKAIKIVGLSAIFAALLVVSASAQTPSGKIGVINTSLFDQAKGGINKYVSVMKSLDTEFKPDDQKLKTLATQMNSLKKEIDTLQKSASNPNVPVKADGINGINAKIEKYNKLAREMKFQQDDAKRRYESRRQVVTAPLFKDISDAIQEYADKNGFSMLLDVSKLGNAGLILALDKRLDVTADFIRFYNARPAGTASTNR